MQLPCSEGVSTAVCIAPSIPCFFLRICEVGGIVYSRRCSNAGQPQLTCLMRGVGQSSRAISPLTYLKYHVVPRRALPTSFPSIIVSNTSILLIMRFIMSMLCLQSVAGIAIEATLSSLLNERNSAPEAVRDTGSIRDARVVTSRRAKASTTPRIRTPTTKATTAIATPTTLRTVQKSATAQPSKTSASPRAAATPSTAPRIGGQTLCPSGNGTTINDDHNDYWYQIRCGQIQSIDQPLEHTVQPSLKSCLERCSLWNSNAASVTGQGCYGSIFEKATGQCQLFYLASTSWFVDPNFDSAATMLG